MGQLKTGSAVDGVSVETTTGAQSKADTAETNANDYTDGEISFMTQELGQHSSDYVKHPAFSVTTGSANDYTVTLDPAPSNYFAGTGVVIQVHEDSTGASTLNVNSLGAIPLQYPDGTDKTDLITGGIYTFRYNSNLGVFMLQG